MVKLVGSYANAFFQMGKQGTIQIYLRSSRHE